MKIVLPGGSGQVGQMLARHFHAEGHKVTVLSRTPKPTPWRTAAWDGRKAESSWTRHLEGADAVIHLSGRSVNCRYNIANRKEIIESRVTPTRCLGKAIAQCGNPPRVWMNASTSTFYRDARDRTGDHEQDEFTGEPGGSEPHVPDTWNFSVDVARRWEDAFYAAETPYTRRIALRSSMTMSPDPGGVFSVLLGLVRAGLGGTQGPGDQYVSWIHDCDYVRAIDFLLTHQDITGPVNLTSPNPLPNRNFMAALRKAWGKSFGLPAASWMLELGAIVLRTETELILKSRRAIPTVLLCRGFTFDFPTWPEAAEDLAARTRQARAPQPVHEDG